MTQTYQQTMLQREGRLERPAVADADVIEVARPFVSVVVPLRNEGQVLERCLRSLLEQSYPEQHIEIIAVDGRSSDYSQKIIQDLMKEFGNLRLCDNPRANTPAGMNVGVRAAKGAIIVIVGAHSVCPQDYIENCVASLDKSGADVVGGPIKTEPTVASLGAQLACAILSNEFGVGNSRFRTGGSEGFVDTVPFGAYRKEVFDQIGLFNESLLRNQDNDLSARVRKAGKKIYFTPLLTAVYFTGTGYIGIIRQTFRKTQWHIRTLRENSRAFGYRHFAPALLVIALGMLGILSLGHVLARVVLASLLTLYLGAGWLYSIRAWQKQSKLITLILPFACIPFHLAYGLGTIFGVRHLFFLNERDSESKDRRAPEST